jgi:UbiD family decarboxylase
MAAFTGHPSMKKVIVVDHDIDIFDDTQVEWALSTRFQASKDMVVIENARGSTLDPSAHYGDRTTSKLGMDATMPVKDRESFLKVR